MGMASRLLQMRVSQRWRQWAEPVAKMLGILSGLDVLSVKEAQDLLTRWLLRNFEVEDGKGGWRPWVVEREDEAVGG